MAIYRIVQTAVQWIKNDIRKRPGKDKWKKILHLCLHRALNMEHCLFVRYTICVWLSKKSIVVSYTQEEYKKSRHNSRFNLSLVKGSKKKTGQLLIVWANF